MLSVLPLRVPVLEADAGTVALEADYLRSADSPRTAHARRECTGCGYAT